MNDRVIYDSALPRTAWVKDIISNNSWHWPISNSPDLLTLKEITHLLAPPATHRSDQILWSPTPSGSYSTSSAWEQFRERKSKVIWWDLTWFHGRIPKATFFLWLAVKKKLWTLERLFNPQPGILCLLCSA